MSKFRIGSGSGVTLSGLGRVRVLDLGSPSGFGFFRVLKNDYNLPKIYTFKAIFSLQKYSVLKNRSILIVFHAGKVEKRNEEKFWGKILRIFVEFDEILPKFWFLIVFGCQKSGSGRVRVSSPRVRVGFGCPKISGYPSGIRVFGSPDTSLEYPIWNDKWYCSCSLLYFTTWAIKSFSTIIHTTTCKRKNLWLTRKISAIT